MEDSLVRFAGVRIYRYRESGEERMALHLPNGATTLDLDIDEARNLSDLLANLVA